MTFVPLEQICYYFQNSETTLLTGVALIDVKTELSNEIVNVKAGHSNEIFDVKTDLSNEITDVKTEFKNEMLTNTNLIKADIATFKSNLSEVKDLTQ